MTERSAVYRLFSTDDDLLYVGVANRPEERWRTHASEKRWWDEVARKSVEWHPTREAALAAEATAILAETPRYNILLPTPDGRRRMRRDAPTTAWASGMPHWEARYGRGLPRGPAAAARGDVMPMRLIRVDPDLWREYGEACQALGVNRSEDMRALMGRRVRAWKRTRKAVTPSD